MIGFNEFFYRKEVLLITIEFLKTFFKSFCRRLLLKQAQIKVSKIRRFHNVEFKVTKDNQI